MSSRKFASTTISDKEDKLGLTPEGVNELLAKAQKSAAITDKFGTIVDGGLVSTITIYLRDLAAMIETAGLSGLKGALEDNPAFWAGGSHADALAVTSFLRKIANNVTPDDNEYLSLAKISLLHNGSGKYGDFIVLESGAVIMVDPGTGKPRLIFSASNIPSVAELEDETLFGDTKSGTSKTVSSMQPSATLISALNVSKDNSTINLSATNLTVNADSMIGGSGRPPRAEVRIVLKRNGVTDRVLYTLSVAPEWGTPGINNAPPIDISIRGVKKGSYDVVLDYYQSDGIIAGSGAIGSSTISWEFKQDDVRYFQFGIDGFMAWFAQNHMHFTKDGGLSVRGKTNIPGTLLSGKVGPTGGFVNVWGAKRHASRTAVKEAGNGSYLVYHSIGHEDYSVQITPSENRTYRVLSETATSFRVQLYSGSTLSNSGFHFTITGRNY